MRTSAKSGDCFYNFGRLIYSHYETHMILQSQTRMKIAFKNLIIFSEKNVPFSVFST